MSHQLSPSPCQGAWSGPEPLTGVRGSLLCHGACVGYTGRAELAGSAPWIKQACLTPQAPAAWGRCNPKQEVGNTCESTHALVAAWTKPGCCAVILTERLPGATWPDCALAACPGWSRSWAEGQTARSDRPHRKRAKAS